PRSTPPLAIQHSRMLSATLGPVHSIHALFSPSVIELQSPSIKTASSRDLRSNGGWKMMKSLKVRVALTAIALLVASVGTTLVLAARDSHKDEVKYHARLSGFGEVPPKLVDGSGTFEGTLSKDHTSISWTISWTDLTGPAQAAHIHFGQPQNIGNVVVFFCGG